MASGHAPVQGSASKSGAVTAVAVVPMPRRPASHVHCLGRSQNRQRPVRGHPAALITASAPQDPTGTTNASSFPIKKCADISNKRPRPKLPRTVGSTRALSQKTAHGLVAKTSDLDPGAGRAAFRSCRRRDGISLFTVVRRTTEWIAPQRRKRRSRAKSSHPNTEPSTRRRKTANKWPHPRKRPAAGAACARVCGPAAAPPPGRASVPRGKQKHAIPGDTAGGASARSTDPRVRMKPLLLGHPLSKRRRGLLSG